MPSRGWQPEDRGRMQSMVPARERIPGPERDPTDVDTTMRFGGRDAGLKVDSCHMLLSLLARMFHTSLGSLHADCRRCAGRVRWPAHPGYWQNRPRNAPQGGQANSLDFPGPDNCSRLYTVASSLFRGAVLNLARISLDYRHHRNRQQEDGHSDGEDCEICGLASCEPRGVLEFDRTMLLTSLARLPR
jgi:hypothetical protein